MEIDEHYTLIFFYVFVPYRGFYFLNEYDGVTYFIDYVFSSPIGAFIFLIGTMYHLKQTAT